MTFPAFADYQDTFSSPLPSVTFVSFTPPSWLPSPTRLTQIARVIYPYWKERKLERGGRRIIPTVNVGAFYRFLAWLRVFNLTSTAG